MIILDTNVVSELTRPVPEPHVVSWVKQLSPGTVFITATTAAELLFGVSRLPDGRRKKLLSQQVGSVIDDDFGRRVISFDIAAAVEYARIASGRRNQGRPISLPDAQIAAVCRRFSATLATRNVKDFEHTGVDVINPWRAAPGTAKA